MFRVNQLSKVFLIASCLVSSAASANDPLGEVAHYRLEKADGRTSSIISSGKLKFSIPRAFPQQDDGSIIASYEARIDFDLKASVLGNQVGSVSVRTPVEYFTPGFWEELRKTKFFDAGDFKIKHEGMVASTKASDGKVYEYLDQIFIYDVVPVADNGWSLLVRTLVEAQYPELIDDPSKYQDLENVQVRALRHPTVPVLGAVKADLTGKYLGISVKAGADYLSNPKIQK